MTNSEFKSITIISPYYAPESTGIAPFNKDLADYLSRNGFKVEVITGVPFFPVWSVSEEYRNCIYKTEKHGDVKVVRCWLYVPKNPSSIRRIIHEISFGLSSTFALLCRNRADLYFVVGPPLTLGLFGSFVSWMRRGSFLFHVQDLQPDAAVRMGMLRSGFLISILYRIEAFIYKRASMVTGITPGMVRAIVQKGVPESKVKCFPNWLRSQAGELVLRSVAKAKMEACYGIPRDAFVVLYSGNMGRKQGLEILIKVARLAEDSGELAFLFVLAGAGAMRGEIEASLKSRPCSTLLLLPLLPEEEYKEMLQTADICVIAQVSGSGSLFFPSKLLTTLQNGRPILAIADADSELTYAVQLGGFGVVVGPDNPAAILEQLYLLRDKPSGLQSMESRTRWVTRFSREKVLGEFLDILYQQIDNSHYNQII